MDEFKAAWSKALEFEGRSRRREYWIFGLISGLLSLIPIIGWIYSFAAIIPSISCSIRRLHDTNRSGWWLLIGIIPIVGWIVIFIFTIQEGDRGINNYGHDPKAINNL